MRGFVVVVRDWHPSYPTRGAPDGAASGSGRSLVAFQVAQADARSSSAAAAAAVAGSPPRSAWAFTIERDAVTRPAAGCGSKAGAEVLDTAALRADAGQQEDRARHQLAQAREELRAGGAGDRPDERQPAVAGVLRAELVDEPREPLVQRRLALVLQLGGARVRGAHQDEAAGARRGGGLDERLERSRGRAAGWR